jgi:tetratricopeptide (TPR) repeat protein
MLQLVEVLTAKGEIDAAGTTARTLVDAFPNHPVAVTLMADVEIRKGDFDSAKTRLEQVLSRSPDFGVANRLLGIVNARQGQVQQAQMRFQRALVQSPNDVRARLHLARLHIDQNNVDAARTALTGPQQQDTRSNALLYALAARAAFRLRERDLGMRFLEDSVELAEGAGPEEQLGIAGALMDAGEQERARELLRASAAGESDNAWLGAFGLALSQVNAREFEAADATIAQLIEALPRVAWPLNLRGMAAAAAGDFAAALTHLSAALELEPNDIPTRLNRARVALLAGRRDAGVADYRAVLERNPNEATALMALAEIALAERNFAEVERLTALAPESVTRLRLEGAAAFGQSRFAEAADKLARAFAEQPTAEHALQAFAAAQRAGNPNPEAPLLTWLAEHPRDAKVNFALGSYALQTNDHDQAIARYEAIIETQPDHADALNNLAWLYDQRGDDRALSFAERAHAAAPDSAAIADTLGWLYVRKGDARKGLPILEQSHAALPQNAEIHYHWAAALAEAGEEERAVAALRELLAAHASFADRAAAEQLLRRLE